MSRLDPESGTTLTLTLIPTLNLIPTLGGVGEENRAARAPQRTDKKKARPTKENSHAPQKRTGEKGETKRTRQQESTSTREQDGGGGEQSTRAQECAGAIVRDPESL